MLLGVVHIIVLVLFIRLKLQGRRASISTETYPRDCAGTYIVKVDGAPYPSEGLLVRLCYPARDVWLELRIDRR